MPVESDAELRELLGLRTVAVVGCSATPGKDAHENPSYLLEHGYEVIPVNPNRETVFGREAYDSLSDVDREIEVVNVFRPSEEVSDVVDQVLEREDVKVLWLQLGISDPDAEARAEDAEIHVVSDRCMKVEHQRLHAP
ncbi:CoA-binding protein [Halalkalicoccus ordinarius]|uniref:CoA-binding protein n=1 Tax=Halalkalicoccus ordinarius TaxID=3116651 RepID=UPI00300E8403